MSNASWVCFGCRRVVRRPTYPRKVVPCPVCKNACFCLGRQIPVPPKDKVAAWTSLRKEMREMTIAWLLRREKASVARRHEVEKQLRKLEALPAEPSRASKITKLREELTGG